MFYFPVVLFIVQCVSNLIFGMSVIISSFCLLPSPPLSLALFIYLFYETLLRDVATGTQRAQNRTQRVEQRAEMHIPHA